MVGSTLLIKGGRVIDPSANVDQQADLFISNGKMQPAGTEPAGGVQVYHAKGRIVSPGLIDMHVHLREPGQEYKETIETGTAAAVAGGLTAVACMPNTRPPIDSPDLVRQLLKKAETDGHCLVYPIACLSLGRAGRELVNFAALKEAGAVAFSDDGDGLADDQLMADAFASLKELDMIVSQHCEDPKYPRGIMHEGTVSRELEVPGISPLAEEDMIARDIKLCRKYDARYHVSHVSTARSVKMVREAKTQGLKITSEVCPHHLLLTHQACREGDPNTKMHPPLRTREDVEACIAGVADGTIDLLVTDHAPHTTEEKARGMIDAPPGIIGLETSLALSVKTLVDPGHIDWPKLITLMSTSPAKVFGLDGGTLAAGRPANVTIIDPDLEWTVDVNQFKSKSRNCPYHGMQLKGKAVCTIVDGVVKHQG